MCVVEFRQGGQVVSTKKIIILDLGGRRRAVTAAEAVGLQAAGSESAESEHRSAGQWGGSSHEQRITRCGYGAKAEWLRKDSHHRACACDGKKSLRAKARARRRTALG